MTIDELDATIASAVRKALKEVHYPTDSKHESVEEFIDVEQASKLLNLSKQTIYTKSSKREIPAMKRGKRLYFSKSELMQYIKEGKRLTNEDIEAEAVKYLQKTRK